MEHANIRSWISYITLMCIICLEVAGDKQEMMCPYRIRSQGCSNKTENFVFFRQMSSRRILAREIESFVLDVRS